MTSPLRRPLLSLLFFLSGFCGLLYQVVWTRMAFAHFGIITPVLSVVISVFMLGLAIGSWAGGRYIGQLTAKAGASAILFYAGAEAVIGLGAFTVPMLFEAGDRLLLATGQSNSLAYLSLSALVLAVSILPSCLCMGTTFPWMMAFIREHEPQNTESFSFLYTANVLGALSGTLLSAFVLIELFGFRSTLAIAAAANFLIAGAALWLGVSSRKSRPSAPAKPRRAFGAQAASAAGSGSRLLKWILFSTGFASMGMEVIWARAFTPVIKTQVYSFASILAAYLLATFVGSIWYRYELRSGKRHALADLLGLLAISAVLPAVVNDVRLVHAGFDYKPDLAGGLLLLASICPFCGLLGYLTPRLVDEYAAGSPAAAGKAYAINVWGCILGPLFACYALLPWLSERHSLVIFSLPFTGFFLVGSRPLPAARRLGFGIPAALALAAALLWSRPYEADVLQHKQPSEVRRDYAASVVSFREGEDAVLVVNGVGMARPHPVTQFMAHLPVAFHAPQPSRALVICFGVGTTYRSCLALGLETTAVELIPSVKDAFGFFYPDPPTNASHGRIVIDDGRRFLKRTHEKYDVIITDPPPPPEAAGSSLLYSKEFYALAKEHLAPGGILQEWIIGDPRTGAAALRSLSESFPHVRCFRGMTGFGVHALGSMDPMPACSAGEIVRRLPEAAKADLLEWSFGQDLVAYVDSVLAGEFPASQALDPVPSVRITDDRPYNEYFFLRGFWPQRNPAIKPGSP